MGTVTLGTRENGEPAEKMEWGVSERPPIIRISCFLLFGFFNFYHAEISFSLPGFARRYVGSACLCGKNLIPSLASAGAANSYWHV